MNLKNESEIIRDPSFRKSNFTIISNTIIEDASLTLEARMLLIYILHLPDTWKVYKENIKKHQNMGRVKFDRIWKELKLGGYIKSERIIDGNTKQFTGWKHTITDNPNVIKPERLETEHTGNPNIGETNHILNTNTAQNDFKKNDFKKRLRLISAANAATDQEKIDTDKHKSFSELFQENKNISVEEYLNN